MRFLIHLIAIYSICHSCLGEIIPFENQITQIFVSTADGMKITDNLYNPVEDYNLYMETDSREKFYLTVQTAANPLETYEVKVADKLMFCVYGTQLNETEYLFIFLCNTVKLYYNGGEPDDVVYTLPKNDSRTNNQFKLSSKMYNHGENVYQHVKIAERYNTPAEDLKEAIDFWENHKNESLSLNVKYLVDYGLQQKFKTKDELLKFIFAINGQADFYFHRGFGHPVSISVHDVQFLTKDESPLRASSMSNFISNQRAPANQTSADTVVYLTDREELNWLGSSGNLGSKSSWAMVAAKKGSFIHSAATLAKALGELLGLQKPLLGFCSYPFFDQWRRIENYQYIMDHTWKSHLFKEHVWSECSQIMSKYFLKKYYSTLTKPKGKSLPAPTKYPGTDYSYGEQCQGLAQATKNRDMFAITNPVNKCSQLICALYQDNQKSYEEVKEKIISDKTKSLVTDVLQGTNCGKDKICLGGECVVDKMRVDGGWGKWKALSARPKCSGKEGENCEFTKKHGVKVEVRYCNNPKPKYGGSKCVGKHLRRKPCSANCVERIRLKNTLRKIRRRLRELREENKNSKKQADEEN